MAWALFHNGEQVSRSHPHKLTACMEAVERGVAIEARFNRAKGFQSALMEGWEVREVKDRQRHKNTRGVEAVIREGR